MYQSVPDAPQMQLCYWYEKPIWYPSWVLHIWHGFFHLLIFNLNFFFKSYNTAFLSYCVFKTWLWYEIFSRCMYGFNLKTLIFILGDLSSFTRFSDNLNNNLEVKVTKILTLRFLIDLEKNKTKKKTCVTSFSSYCVHKVGCPWCPAPTQPAEWGQFIKIKILKKLSLLKKKRVLHVEHQSTYLQHTICSIFIGRYLDKISDVLLIKHLLIQNMVITTEAE